MIPRTADGAPIGKRTKTQKSAYYGIGKLEKQGMLENSASLAALRAAITLRNEKVVANVSEKLHFDEEELLAVVETKKCPIPGVNFRETDNSWEVIWREQKRQKTCYFPLKKFEAHSTTEEEAFLIALRTAIDFRARQVGLRLQRGMKMIKIIEEGV